MRSNEVLSAYQLSQQAIANLKYSVLVVLNEGPKSGSRNVDIGKALGIYAGHARHEGHIPRVLLSSLEHEGLVIQDTETKRWKLRENSQSSSTTTTKPLVGVKEVRPDFKPLKKVDTKGSEADLNIVEFYESYKAKNDQRPLAADLSAAGYNIKTLRSEFGTWFDFVDQMGDLNAKEQQILRDQREFFGLIEKTAMTKSFKMLTLLAMLDANAITGSVSLDELASHIDFHAQQDDRLRADFGERLESHSKLKKLLRDNPINAWIGGNTGKPSKYFKYEDDRFGSNIDVAESLIEYFEAMAQELIDWRICEYLARPALNPDSFQCRVIQSGGRPIIRLPDRDKYEFPEGETPLEVDGKKYTAKFVKYFLNVIRDSSGENVLGELVRGFYGQDAGQPGTRFDVVFMKDPEVGWSMGPPENG